MTTSSSRPELYHATAFDFALSIGRIQKTLMIPSQRARVCLLFCAFISLILRQKAYAMRRAGIHLFFVAFLWQRNRRMALVVRRMLANRLRVRGRIRRVWTWPRPQNWFETLLICPQMDPLWKMHFKVNRQTFQSLCILVQTDIEKQHTRMRAPVSVEKRVAVSLWRLATGDSYTSCGLQFGIGRSTAKIVCSEFENALVRLKNDFIKFPLTRTEIEEKMREFEEEYGFPQAVGAIDGCQIKIYAPAVNKEDYFSRKQEYSANLQAVADCSSRLLHVSFGYPGSIHDARVLRLSGLYDLGINQQILEGPTSVLNGTQIAPYIVGDTAYPLMQWLVRPYRETGHLTPQQIKFNRELSALHSVVERAFGMLKKRWRLLYKKIEQKLRSLKTTVIAACVLHNICIEHGDLFDEDSDTNDSDDDEVDFLHDPRENGENVREALTAFVWDNL